MAYSINTLLSDLSGVTHGTTANKIPNIFGAINRAARQVIQDVDPKETQRIVSLSQVFNSVFDYPIPVDVKGDRIIDLRPQAGRTPLDIFVQGYSLDFDAYKNVSLADKIITQWNTGVKTLRIQAPTLTSPTTLTDTSTITGWTATAGAQNITLDTTLNVAGGGDIQFDLAAGSSTGSIQISTLSAVDLTGLVNIGYLFYWVYLPDASAITSLTLRWGSDVTANYYTYTNTTTQQGTAFQTGWNLIAIPWASATKVGSPTTTGYDSVQLIPIYNSTLQTGLRFCNLTCAPGYIYQLQYYSKYMFRNPSTNVFQETVVDVATDGNTIINLDTDSYNLLFNKTAQFVAQSLQGADAEYDAVFFEKEYITGLIKYKSLNPSETILKSATYYHPANRKYPRYFNNR
jgi:hypothetical protein